jgi:hypothetical protein
MSCCVHEQLANVQLLCWCAAAGSRTCCCEALLLYSCQPNTPAQTVPHLNQQEFPIVVPAASTAARQLPGEQQQQPHHKPLVFYTVLVSYHTPEEGLLLLLW